MGVISIVNGDYKPTYNYGGTTLHEIPMIFALQLSAPPAGSAGHIASPAGARRRGGGPAPRPPPSGSAALDGGILRGSGSS